LYLLICRVMHFVVT